MFRELFKEALDIQKERIKDIRKYASDQRKRQESRRQNEIDSMENLYPFYNIDNTLYYPKIPHHLVFTQ